MSTYGLMALGTRAMTAAQAQLQTTGHNITNASVEGYSRQSVVLSTSPSQYSGAGYFGRGVDISTVTRVVNSFLTNDVAQTGATAAMDRQQADLLNQLQSAFGTGEAGLGSATMALFSAWSDLASHPGDASARQVVLARADDLASLTRNSAQQIEGLQGAVVDSVKVGAAKVNNLASQVASLNQQIMASRGSGQTPNDLLDQRDQVIDQISQFVQVTRVEQASSDTQGATPENEATNPVNLFIGAGQSLVLGSQAYKLVPTKDEFAQGRVGLAIQIGATERPLSTSVLGGGSMAGTLKFQDDDLSDARNQLGRLAAAITGEVNQQQQLGLDLNGRPGAALFRPVGSLNAGSGNYDIAARAASSNTSSATASISISDPGALQPSDYELTVAANGSYTVAALSGSPDQRKPVAVADGQAVAGFTVHLTAGSAKPGDRFLLQPVTLAAQSVQVDLRDPKGVAAASSVTAAAAAANKGSANIASLNVTNARTSSSQQFSLQFTNDLGAYNVLSSANASATPSVVGSGNWTPGSPISVNGIQISLSGAPRANDQFDVAPTRSWASSNGNALAMVGLGSQAVVDGANLADAYAGLLSDVGVRVQSANSAAEVSGSVASQAKATLSSQTGVNLDEEAAKLIQYQQAYQAAAKILQVAQKIFDTVLGMTNG